MRQVSESNALIRGGLAMRGPYPGELTRRVISFVEAGGSRREAAEQFDIGVSSAIRCMQRFREDGTCEPMRAEETLRHWRSMPTRSLRSTPNGQASHWMRSSWRCTSAEFREAAVRSPD